MFQSVASGPPVKSSCRPLFLNKSGVKDVEFTLLVVGILTALFGLLAYFRVAGLHGINTTITYSTLGAGGGLTFLSSCLLSVSYKKRVDTHVAPENDDLKQEKINFKQRALETFGNEEPKQQKDLASDYGNPQVEALEVLHDEQKQNDRVKTGGGGLTKWVAHDEVPGVIWKKAKMAEHAFGASHQAMVERAQKICKDHDLYLLYVPSSELLAGGVLLQEKVELQGEGTHRAQKGLFRWALGQEEMQDYMHELFRQLTVFICKSGFSDVKYDNIALTTDGRIALFDLDDSNAITGLMRGRDRRVEVGIFGMLPPRWFEEFQGIARKNDVDLKAGHAPGWIKYHKKKAEKRKYKRRDRNEFYKERGVQTPQQKLHIPDNLDPNLKKVLECINNVIVLAKGYDLLAARKVKIAYAKVNPMWKEIGINSDVDFVVKFPKYLKELKSLGYIFSYKESCSEGWKKDHRHDDSEHPALCETGSFKIVV